MTYIVKYKYQNDFNIQDFFGQFVEGEDYQKHWPAVIVSRSSLSNESYNTFHRDMLEGKKKSKPSVCMESSIESVPTEIIKVLGLTGITFSVLSSCSASAYALYQAGLISAAQQTPVIVACADRLTDMGAYWFTSLGAISPETGIPFDKNSRGFKPGVGQAFFVVDSRKNVDVVAHIKTMRFFTQPSERTSVGSIQDIKDHMFNGIDMSEISWWNAHAPGTPVGDKAEYGLFKSFNKDIPISSFKGTYGHLLASSYLFELGLMLDSAKQKVARANAGIQTPIEDDHRIIQSDVHIHSNTVLKFNMGFGGKNVLSITDIFL
jgi:3-oxoacyl-[acyl-carrier-protein] synthase II